MEGACVGGLPCMPSISKMARIHMPSGIRSSPYLHAIPGFRNSSLFCGARLKSNLLHKSKESLSHHALGLGFSGRIRVGGLRKTSTEASQFVTTARTPRQRNLKCSERLSIRGKAAAAAGASNGPGDFESVPVDPSKQFLGVDVQTLKKVIPLGLMSFCIVFNHTILIDTRDVLVVTAEGSGAEIIPFLKTWVKLPMTICYMVVYNLFSNELSKEAHFYTSIFIFIGFFGAFGFFLHPLKDTLHPTGLADKLLQMLGPSFMGPIATLRIWTFSVYYVMAELWGRVFVAALFWGFANHITTVDEAQQFYPLLGVVHNVALVFSGCTVKYFSHLGTNLGPGVDGWAVSLKGMMSLVVLLGLATAGIYWLTNRYVVNDPTLPKAEASKKIEKPKLGMVDSAKILLKSRYVRDLAILVVAYEIGVDLVEVTWNSKLHEQFPRPNEYSAFMGDLSTYTGIVTLSMMLLSRYIFRKHGWGVAAIITPTVLLVTGVAFFALVLGRDLFTPLMANFGFAPLLAAVYVGSMHIIFSESAKGSLFGPCEEMAYTPLDEDTKVKGKAAIGVVCNPLKESGGPLIHQVLILGFGSLANSTPFVGAILVATVVSWLYVARSLDHQFTSLLKDSNSKLLEGK